MTILKNKQTKETENIKKDLNAIKRIAFENEKKFNNIDKKMRQV